MSAETALKARPELPDHAPHVLLVDDDRRVRELLSRFLSEQGFRVTAAANAAEARLRGQCFVFDALVLDVMMPGENGFDLARFIRSSSTVPIIMLTARHEAEARIEGLQIGADDYVAKPFEPRELVLRIGNILKRTAPPQTVTVEQIAASAPTSSTSSAASCARARRSSISPTASARCCASSRARPARPCRAPS
jgi:two-component system phosphate regulon response regulator OmpR